ncbi:MAG: (2Fe-2S)-binding protein [Gammaproteobacteria bacterium]|nr:(2Fe-2S)-binding protein [Gammaproteobacteria bacterium]MCP4089766.1 (2Fe-2S)-binding protein [Gammaproteobacteria bacterium]MCP4278217.1 (2Fe-2S)-binding protein [Gammaproteobacteria bacterium]MCP4831936.1 (2Fe-2S)-binding protein [Gammaproteobacteria bacterium]MCP4927592.1 (2Fe-2S)-binding protein [Gammaproteobacteria bacterium]
MISFKLNGEAVTVDVPSDMPLLWVLRDQLGMTGTKFGCGIAQCGACTVHMDGQVMRSCVVPVNAVAGRSVRTIENLADDASLSLVQQAWIEERVVQCGYCQPGFLMAATALLDKNPNPNDSEIDAAITNICRCGTYPRIRKAIHRAAAIRRGE